MWQLYLEYSRRPLFGKITENSLFYQVYYIDMYQNLTNRQGTACQKKASTNWYSIGNRVERFENYRELHYSIEQGLKQSDCVCDDCYKAVLSQKSNNCTSGNRLIWQ
jgi:hypothetical protein